MKTPQTLLTILVFIASLAGGFYIFRGASHFSMGDVTEVDWRLLAGMDYISGKPTGELEQLNGKSVRIPGFMVPLEDDMKHVTEFLLVPSAQACIHVPPPPPNQMVLVKMDARAKTEVAFGPIWIYGKLVIEPKRHQFGQSSFQLEGMKVEAYRPN